MEDLQQGVGQVSQTRNDTVYSVGKIDVPYAVNSEAEMTALDIEVYTRARIYTSTTSFTDYIYDPLDATGIAPDVGSGSWISLDTLATNYDSVTSMIAANLSAGLTVRTLRS